MISSDYVLATMAQQKIELETWSPAEESTTTFFNDRTLIHFRYGIDEGLELAKKVSDLSIKNLLFKLACKEYCHAGLFIKALECARNLDDPSDTLAYIDLYEDGRTPQGKEIT